MSKNDKKNKRRRANLSALLLILLLISLGVNVYSSSKNKKILDEKERVQVELDKKTEETKDLKGKNEELKKEVDALKKAQEGKTYNDGKVMQPTGKGKNHNQAANAYAYDTALVRDAIKGKIAFNKKICFLTFDDGPNNSISPKILDTLKEKGVHATFFLVGKNVSENTEDVLKREYDEGHAIALHSYSHEYHDLYPGRSANKDEIVSQAQKAQEKLQEYLGQDFKTGVWRYPGGHMSWKNLEGADQGLKDMGIEWIDWNCLTGDAEPKSRRPSTAQGQVEFLNSSISQATNKDVLVVLSHDAEGKTITEEALPHVIDNLKDQGYEFGILE